MTDAVEMRTIAEAAAKAAVEETLVKLGIDVSNPIKAQQDFMVLREVGKLVMDSEFRKDMEHLRTWRMAINDVKSKGLITLVGIIVTGSVALIVAGFRGWIKLP
ncbi:hypothetical protein RCSIMONEHASTD_11 [Rhodobacter phage RcSimone-Hastad]|nr:hypothetical protein RCSIMONEHASTD_11 [Rhodobacter phage RcSimone-Hastad]